MASALLSSRRRHGSPLGARGARLQSIQAPLVEVVVDGVASRLGVASQTPGYPPGRGLCARARQKYLAPAQNKGVFGAQPGGKNLALLL